MVVLRLRSLWTEFLFKNAHVGERFLFADGYHNRYEGQGDYLAVDLVSCAMSRLLILVDKCFVHRLTV